MGWIFQQDAIVWIWCRHTCFLPYLSDMASLEQEMERAIVVSVIGQGSYRRGRKRRDPCRFAAARWWSHHSSLLSGKFFDNVFDRRLEIHLNGPWHGG
jgi:hypothetical protein